MQSPVLSIKDICTPRHKSLYRLLLARDDIHEAAEYSKLILAIKAGDSSTLYRGLFTALAVSYERAFVNTEPFGRISSKWSKFDLERHQWLHEQLMGLRNTAVAHSDLKMHPFILFAPGRVIPGTNIINPDIAIEIDSGDLDPKNIPEIRTMCLGLVARLNKAIFQEWDTLFKGKTFPDEGVLITTNCF